MYNVYMMSNFTYEKPPVGSTIAVRTYHALTGYSVSTKRTFIKRGLVVKSERHDDANSFRLATGDPNFPVSVIDLDVVTGIKYQDGATAGTKERTVLAVQAWEVPSDSRKGGTYTVTYSNGHFDCSCLGFTYRKFCRHVNKVKKDVA